MLICLSCCGCEIASEKNDYENIETCKNNGGIAKIEYFGDSNEIKKVTCLYE
jgi:hypothetical protein